MKKTWFQEKCSKSTLSVELQPQVARALDDDKYVVLVCLDLSLAFDMVNVDMLIKRLKRISLPCEIKDLIKVWLKGKSFFISIEFFLTFCLVQSNF
jgi:hypothetical protein